MILQHVFTRALHILAAVISTASFSHQYLEYHGRDDINCSMRLFVVVSSGGELDLQFVEHMEELNIGHDLGSSFQEVCLNVNDPVAYGLFFDNYQYLNANADAKDGIGIEDRNQNHMESQKLIHSMAVMGDDGNKCLTYDIFDLDQILEDSRQEDIMCEDSYQIRNLSWMTSCYRGLYIMQFLTEHPLLTDAGGWEQSDISRYVADYSGRMKNITSEDRHDRGLRKRDMSESTTSIQTKSKSTSRDENIHNNDSIIADDVDDNLGVYDFTTTFFVI